MVMYRFGCYDDIVELFGLIKNKEVLYGYVFSFKYFGGCMVHRLVCLEVFNRVMK